MKTMEKTDRTGLVRKFDKIGLKLKLTRSPMLGGLVGPGSNAFQMDINRPGASKGPREIFRIWPGHNDNRLEVIGINDDLQQAVLMVKEPKRTIEIEISRWETRRTGWRERLAASNNVPVERIVKKNGRWFLLRDTPEAKRHYLCGMDERHLFICQLPKAASTVTDAHKVLKAETVTEREKKNEVDRQGEWFFLQPTKAQREALDIAIRGTKAVILQKVGIGQHMGFTLGRPHTADELAVIAAPTGKVREVETRHRGRPDDILSTDQVPEMVRTVFIRGKVKHVEHKTVEFKDWVLVVRNTEIRNSGLDRSFNGINWID